MDIRLAARKIRTEIARSRTGGLPSLAAVFVLALTPVAGSYAVLLVTPAGTVEPDETEPAFDFPR